MPVHTIDGTPASFRDSPERKLERTSV